MATAAPQKIQLAVSKIAAINAEITTLRHIVSSHNAQLHAVFKANLSPIAIGFYKSTVYSDT
jgi:hypothetical protein